MAITVKSISEKMGINPSLEKISIGCQPVGVGAIYEGGWNWLHPAIAHIKGTAGTLDRWAIGYKRTYRPLNGDPEEVTIEWQSLSASREEADDWLNV